jgi:hypothetical protein
MIIKEFLPFISTFEYVDLVNSNTGKSKVIKPYALTNKKYINKEIINYAYFTQKMIKIII